MKTEIDIVVKGLYVPKRLDAYLAQALAGKYSRQDVTQAFKKESVLLNGKKARPRDPVKEGDSVRASLDSEKGNTPVGEDIELKVIYEDDTLFVIDKPVGMVVHPGAGHKEGTLVHALLGRKTELSNVGGALRPGIVHRLDKETSGILLVAKTNVAHKGLQSQFSSRTLSKTYLALVKGRVEFEEGHVDVPLGRDPKVRQKRAVAKDDERSRDAETLYRVLKRYRYSTLLEVKIITGRTHQIRVHMRYLGHPVIGDALYGSDADKKAPRMALHAAAIEFLHPKTGKLMKFESPVPEEMKKMIDAEAKK